MRQPGSTFKPIVYTAAIDYLGYTPSTIVPDKAISIITDSGDVWEPKNFEKRFDGDITLRTALQKSKNAVAAYLIQQVGVEKVVNLAKKFGLTTPIGRNPSICLGAAEVKILELVSVYGIFPTGGKLAQRIVISKIVDRNGKVIYEQTPKLEKVLSEETAFIMTNLLRGVIQYGTGRRVSALGVPVASKTGTANNQTDTCFVGFTPEWVTGVWVGFDTKRAIGEDDMAAASVTAPLFLNFMKDFLAGKEVVDFTIPNGVVPVPINISTGLYSDDSNAFIDYFKKGTEPIPGAVDTRISKDYLSNDDF
jgi:penicillin-binding protein 1A